MAQNLTCGGVAPAMAAVGMHPGGFYEFEDSSIAGVGAAADAGVDVFETILRLRMMGTSCVAKAVVEDRFASANATKPQKFDIAQFMEGETEVGIFRLPEEKDESGWRGPGCVLELDLANNAVVVKYQGVPYMIPLRHLPKHLALFAKIECAYRCDICEPAPLRNFPAFEAKDGPSDIL
jgi:hypothetical protein